MSGEAAATAKQTQTVQVRQIEFLDFAILLLPRNISRRGSLATLDYIVGNFHIENTGFSRRRTDWSATSRAGDGDEKYKHFTTSSFNSPCSLFLVPYSIFRLVINVTEPETVLRSEFSDEMFLPFLAFQDINSASQQSIFVSVLILLKTMFRLHQKLLRTL